MPGIWDESGNSLPAGASTEAKQDIGNTSLSNIDTAIGAKSDAVASSDTGTFSLIALIKRLLDKLTSIISVRITDGAGTANTRQLGNQLTSADVGLITNTIMHGLTTGGGLQYKEY